MPKASFAIYLRLTEDENLLAEALKMQGITYKGIFLAGLNKLAIQPPKEIIQKAKEIVK